MIAYILLAGYPPFYIHETSSQAEQGSNEEALLRKIVNADYQFHPDTWQDISPEAISFIRSVKLNYRKKVFFFLIKLICQRQLRPPSIQFLKLI